MVFTQNGRIANATVGDYLIPANADVPDIDVGLRRHAGHGSAPSVPKVWVRSRVGLSIAIANAVYHATAEIRRCRSP